MDEIFCSGILVIFEMVFSISSLAIFNLDVLFLLIFMKAPVSSMISIALSGKNLSLMYLFDNSIADLIASSV